MHLYKVSRFSKMVVISSFLPILGFSCSNSQRVLNPSEKSFSKSNQIGNFHSTLKGIVLDQQGEPIYYAQVRMLSEKGEFVKGVITDLEGKFIIQSDFDGKFNLQISAAGFSSNVYPMEGWMTLEQNKTALVEIVMTEEIMMVEPLKPILYFYPRDTIDVSVQVVGDLQLKNCYPEYNMGWQVTAFPDGTLKDSTSRTYYALFWEADMSGLFDAQDGFVVARENNIKFLEDKLSILGLSDREANEFIVFWLPILNQSPYNFIHFSIEDYSNQVQLNITPNPDQVIRFLMLYRPLDQPIECGEQILSPINRNTDGFLVVEWGGSILPDANP